MTITEESTNPVVKELERQGLYLVFSLKENYTMLVSDTALQEIFKISDELMIKLKKALTEKRNFKLNDSTVISLWREHIFTPE